MRRALFTVVAIVFVDLLGFGVVIPILPYYVRSFGEGPLFTALIGILAGSYSLMQFLSAPVLGRLADGWGRRPVLLLSVAGNAVAWTVFGLAGEAQVVLGTGGAIATLFASRMLAGAMGGNIAAAQAYVADLSPPDRRASALGLVGASFGLGFVFGPALGGFFASDAVVAGAERLFPAYIPATRFSLPSFAAAALSLISLLLGLVFLYEPPRTPTDRPPGATSPTTGRGSLRAALSAEPLRGQVLVFFLTAVAFSGVQVAFIPFLADRLGYDASQAALLLTYIGALGVINQGIVVGRMARRVAPERIARGGAVFNAVALALIPLAPALGAELPVGGRAGALVVLLGVLALLSAGNGLLTVALSTLTSLSAGAEEQGRVFGLTQSAASLGRTIGPPIMTTLYALAAFWTPFALGALLALPVFWMLAAAPARPSQPR